jgi:hypothetical protein
MWTYDGDMFVLNIDQRITELDANVNELRFMLENRQKFPDPEDYPLRDYLQSFWRGQRPI